MDGTETAENCQLEKDGVDSKGKSKEKVIRKLKSIFGSPAPLVSGQYKDEVYSMKYKIKGHCHIFSHKNFDSSLGGCNYIEETELDTELLEKTFRERNFEVMLHEDYKLKDIRKVISKVSSEDHSEIGCLILCFLTYGEQAELYAKDRTYTIESVLAPFCTSLPGKPKIFIFQTKKPNFHEDTSRESTDSGVADRLMRKRYYTTKIPSYSDFLIASSTFSGSYTLTNGQKVSNFIRILCHVLWKYSIDFLSILTLVNSEMVKSFQSSELEENFYFKSTLTRILKFENKK